VDPVGEMANELGVEEVEVGRAFGQGHCGK
jgi:hypothetical protein